MFPLFRKMSFGLPPSDRQPGMGIKLLSAGLGGCTADIMTFPLDTAKVRLQVSPPLCAFLFACFSPTFVSLGPKRHSGDDRRWGRSFSAGGTSVPRCGWHFVDHHSGGRRPSALWRPNGRTAAATVLRFCSHRGLRLRARLLFTQPQW